MLSHYRGNEEGDTATISRWSGMIGRDAEFEALYAVYQRLFDRVVTFPSTLAHWREGYNPLWVCEARRRWPLRRTNDG